MTEEKTPARRAVLEWRKAHVAWARSVALRMSVERTMSEPPRAARIVNRPSMDPGEEPGVPSYELVETDYEPDPDAHRLADLKSRRALERATQALLGKTRVLLEVVSGVDRRLQIRAAADTLHWDWVRQGQAAPGSVATPIETLRELRALGWLLTELFPAARPETELTDAEQNVLDALPASHEEPAQTQERLIDPSGRDKSTISRSIKRLRELELVQKGELRRTEKGDEQSLI